MQRSRLLLFRRIIATAALSMLAPAVVHAADPQSYTVAIAAHGQEALARLGADRFDVVVTDLNMPVMDGYGLIEYRNRQCPNIPLVVVTADASPKVMRRLGELGIRECFEKPFSVEAIMHVLCDKLGARSCGPSIPGKIRSSRACPSDILAQAGQGDG